MAGVSAVVSWSSVKVALVISSLAGGGAERVLSVLASGLAERGHQVWLLTLDRSENDVYPLSSAVNRVGLDLLRPAHSMPAAVINNVTRIRVLRKALARTRAEVVVSFMTSTNVLARLATLGLSKPLIASERNEPEHQSLGRAWRMLRRHVVSRSELVVVQTDRIADWWREHIPGVDVAVVPNPVQVDADTSPDAATRNVLAWADGRRIVLAAGRLVRQKGFDLLIEAFSRLRPDRERSWCLVILGEGEERSHLEHVVEARDCNDSVLLPGFSSTPHALMRSADIFALSSRFEGMPNVVLEAMRCGLPVISYDCPTGPAELISHGQTGVLVPAEDVSGFSEALEALMHDQSYRKRLGDRAKAGSVQWDLHGVLDQWETVFDNVRRAPPPGL
ncbi:glycosyltransferase family 4 protein [Salinisphaera orenii]|uniref:Glycosyl transferase n=1 Tax=Salinisphaera orenii YIM 95161 TaxID=1051139 RepID=A0A423Q1H2_9GAMM|nr:glycosyltransferase family 4 protein [Salinisphaera halophila]ROO32377.1 glycosyl transferase [Salinisphaera halophila YIM 95161]